MTDTTTAPSGSVDATPMSFDQGVNAIESLLGDVPEKDSVEVPVAEPQAEVVTEPTVEAGEDDDMLAALTNEPVEEAEVQTEAPATVPDTAMVTLDDGTTISIAELKTNNMFQRTFSRKTEELARHREQLEQQVSQRLSEAENELRQRRDVVLELASQFMPPEPGLEMMQTDPLGYIEAKAMYDARMRQLNDLHMRREQERAAEQQRAQQQTQSFIAEQQQKLFEVLPQLKDEAKREAFRKDVMDVGVKLYGVTPGEANSINDHRYMRILHDAIAYQKLKQKAGSVQKQVAAKPKLVQQNRMAPQAVQHRDQQGRFENLRKEGSIDAAAKAIEAFLD